MSDDYTLKEAPFLRDITLRLWWQNNFYRFPEFSWDDVTNHARYCDNLRDLAARLRKIQEEP